MLEQYLASERQSVLDLLMELCQIPAPSNHEEKRAAFCKSWLEDNGAEGVYIDEKLNVVYPYALEEHDELVVFAAHIDVVFPDTEKLPLAVKGDRLCCPGIGDDTANVAVLMHVIKYFAKHRPKTSYGVLFVCNSGEEGLGNLKGSREIVRKFGDRMNAFVSFDGYFTGISNKAVGSSRYRITCKTSGGHSYADFGKPSAVRYLSELVTRLYSFKLPDLGGRKLTYNVGMIEGGTSVNTIAQEASCLYEYRSDCLEGMEAARAFFSAVIEGYSEDPDVEIEVELLGERPCSAECLDKKRQAEIQSFAQKAIKDRTGLSVPLEYGSTDSNIPLSIGIPAMTLGVVRGGGPHTREEWIETASLEQGFAIAMDVALFVSGAEN